MCVRIKQGAEAHYVETLYTHTHTHTHTHPTFLISPPSYLPPYPSSLSFSPSPGPLPPGISLSQLLDEVEEDQEHRGALVQLAESCLMLAGPCTAAPLTRWAASRCKATGEAVYTIPSLWLHISENEQRILSCLGPGQRARGVHQLSLDTRGREQGPEMLTSGPG